MRQENFGEFEASLSYIVNSRPALGKSKYPSSKLFRTRVERYVSGSFLLNLYCEVLALAVIM